MLTPGVCPTGEHVVLEGVRIIGTELVEAPAPPAKAGKRKRVAADARWLVSINIRPPYTSTSYACTLKGVTLDSQTPEARVRDAWLLCPALHADCTIP